MASASSDLAAELRDFSDAITVRCRVAEVTEIVLEAGTGVRATLVTADHDVYADRSESPLILEIAMRGRRVAVGDEFDVQVRRP